MEMDEKKIVFKSIDEQLAEDEREAAASPKSSDKSVQKASTGQKRGRKKLRLKKSVRRTVGSLMLATSIVVAAVPVGGVSADSSGDYKGSDKKVADFTFNPNLDVVENLVPTNTGTVGGFPLIPEMSEGSYIKRDFGGKSFYVVDSEGYSSIDYVRPIYAMKNTNIEKYFESNGSTDVYTPPGNKLNLVIGTVNYDESGWVDEGGKKYLKWDDGEHLYILEHVPYNLAGYTEQLYGKTVRI